MEDNIQSLFDKLQLNDIIKTFTGKNRKPLGVTFEITPVCNLQCVHCYLGSRKKKENELGFDNIKKILDVLAANGVLFLTLTGGEVFTHPDFEKIYVYAKCKGFIIVVFSNGILLNEKLIKVFNEYPPFLIDISIYGASEKTYLKVTGDGSAFKKLIDALNLLKENKLRFALKTPVLSINCHELPDMQIINNRYCKDRLRYSFDIAPDRDDDGKPLSYAIDNLEEVLLEATDEFTARTLFNKASEKNNWHYAKEKGEFIPSHLCYIARSEFHIDYSGNASACIECNEKFNILEDDFWNLWEKLGEYKKIHACEKYKCIECDSLFYCKSCPQLRQRKYGNEQIVKTEDCITAKLKKKYYVDKVSAKELKDYYEKMKGDESNGLC